MKTTFLKNQIELDKLITNCQAVGNIYYSNGNYEKINWRKQMIMCIVYNNGNETYERIDRILFLKHKFISFITKLLFINRN